MNSYKIESLATDSKDMESGLFDMILSGPPEYVYTSIGYNNDYLLRGTKKKLITSITSVDEWELLLEFHRETIGIDAFEILLLDNFNEKNLVDINSKYRDHFNNIGIRHPRGIEELERFREISNQYPDYIMIRLNPDNYNEEMIKFCEEKKIKIIADGVFGYGENLIIEYGAELLLAFASFHADIVLIPTLYGYEKFYFYSEIAKTYIKGMMPFESIQYLLPDESINRENVPYRKPAVNLYIKINEVSILNIGSPGLHPLSDPDLYWLPAKDDQEFIDTKPKLTKIEREASNALNSMVEGRNLISEDEVSALGRYIVTGIIKSHTSRLKMIKTEYSKLGNLFIIKAAHKFLWWIKSSFLYSIRKYPGPSGKYRVFFLEKDD